MKDTFKLSLLASCIFLLVGCNQTDTNSAEDDQTASSPFTFESRPVKHTRPIQVIELSPNQSINAKHFTGELQSVETAEIAFRVPGTIDAILVKAGELVKKGQVIAELDPHDYQVALQELEARLLEAQSAHKLAQSELKRITQATKDNAIADVNLDRAISGYERSAAMVKVVEKNIQRSQDSLRYTKLVAPFDGVIGATKIDQYEQVLPGIPVVTLHKPDQLEVTIDVPENLIHEFKIGQKAQVKWYGSHEAISAEASEISSVPHLIKQTYSVTFYLNGFDEQLLPGKTVTVTTHSSDKKQEYCVPYSSLVGIKETQHILKVNTQQITTIPVELISVDAEQACVSGDLNTGDQIVISGAAYLTKGDIVTSIQVKAL
ncbi:efflux RND transporter periplasmic adaptor subunit [Vibrio cortegadensis]|uniref:efflux RND transporter periplasmic adaptor subunit n=1 Tax=Vibrio cortegadensis TaxID=1328770 RepID=UPI0021C2AEDE|nr:efflux RND transporter periplasmic adaptor subunit [Vibrio cortegadensis]MDN3697055.1 efflux RND transporter periplasmic adaptor subunit [Vibrio cortegadensis]